AVRAGGIDRGEQRQQAAGRSSGLPVRRAPAPERDGAQGQAAGGGVLQLGPCGHGYAGCHPEFEGRVRSPYPFAGQPIVSASAQSFAEGNGEATTDLLLSAAFLSPFAKALARDGRVLLARVPARHLLLDFANTAASQGEWLVLPARRGAARRRHRGLLC